jgi:predicted nucleic acid-binding Zn ribbon protein
VTRQTEDEFEPDDDDDEDVDDREAPDDSDVVDDDPDGVDTLPCPNCDRPVYEHAQVCPHCRSFLSFEDAPRHRPLWIWIAAILALIGVGWGAIWLLIRILTNS